MQHSFSYVEYATEEKRRHFGGDADSTETPQRCVSVRMSIFLFSNKQLRQNTRLSVSTTYVASFSAGIDERSVAGVESSSLQHRAGDRVLLGAGKVARPQPPSAVPVQGTCTIWESTASQPRPERSRRRSVGQRKRATQAETAEGSLC